MNGDLWTRFDAEREIYCGLIVIFVMMLGVILTSRANPSEFFTELATQGSQTATSLCKEESKVE